MNWLGVVWVAVLAVSAFAEDASSVGPVTLDDEYQGSSLGEALGSGKSYGFFCTPHGQMSPTFAYNDKDCAADGSVQKCGEVWCCNTPKKGDYSCAREHRVEDTQCSEQSKPKCSGPVPTGKSVAEEDGGCRDSHDAICEAAKAYGHCKHSSYAAECPMSCGTCEGSDSMNKNKMKNVIAQVQAEVQMKGMDKSDDATQVAQAADMKMDKRKAAAAEATGAVQKVEAQVRKAKKKLDKAEDKSAVRIEKAEKAGVEFVKKKTAALKKKEKAQDNALIEAKAKVRKDARKTEMAKMSLKTAAASADGQKDDKAGVIEAKGQMKAAEAEKTAAEKKVELAKNLVAKESSAMKNKVASQRKVVASASKSLSKAKDKRANADAALADAKARLTELRNEAGEEAPDERQVLHVRNKLEKAEHKLNQAKEEDAVASSEEKNVGAKLNKQKVAVATAEANVKAAIDQAKTEGEAKKMKLEETMEEKEEKKEEEKMEGDAERKVEEIAIENRKHEAMKEEEKEETIFTDADLKSKSEAAFLRTETKIDEIFDNVKPLIGNLMIKFKAPEGNSTNDVPAEGGNLPNGPVTAGEVNKLFAAKGQDDGKAGNKLTKAMMKNMEKAKEMMIEAKSKIGKLQAVVSDDTAVVDVPKGVMQEAKAEAKKEGDKLGMKKGKAEGEKLGEQEEKEGMHKAEAAAEKKVSMAEHAEEVLEGQDDKSQAKEVDTAAKVQGREEDVKDLQADVDLAVKQMKRDNVPAKTMKGAQSAVKRAMNRVRSANSKVRSARALRKSAKATLQGDKQEASAEEEEKNKRIDKIQKRSEDKLDAIASKVEDRKVELQTEKSKEGSVRRVKAKVKRLKASVKADEAQADAAKNDLAKVEQKDKAIRQKVASQIKEAEGMEEEKEKEAMTKAKTRSHRDISSAKSYLTEVKGELEKKMKEAEATGDLAAGKATMCKELVPGSTESKDEAPLCATIKEESHCNIFDYARYCAKSCGTCIL